MLRAAVALLVTLLAGATAISIDQHGVPVKIADKVPAAAVPFRLEEVRLLDGPFRDAMIRDQDYLMSLDPDRLLHTFRLNAGLPSSAAPLGGWEAPEVELRGHTMGHYLSALAQMFATTGDARYKTRADAMVAELAKIQDAAAKTFHPGYLSAFPEELFDRVDAGRRVWAPYYTIHKIMAGLLDVHQLCDNAQALDVLKKQADWVRFRVDRLSQDQQQVALKTEFGGMNEVLANLYAVTGDTEYLRVAKTFDDKSIFDPLARGEDPLNGKHANTQIPKVIGAAREYELTGDAHYRRIAEFFWDRVVHSRSYVIGGNSDDEAFFPPEEFSRHLGTSSAETCNTYNMLKLTRHLFSWEPSAQTMDFYERALFNHILPSQDPRTGGVLYYCPLRPAAYKTFSTPTDSFWCCVGTGMENHGKYNDTIYFHDDQSVYVNLFIASELTWRDKGVTLRQETHFPTEDTTRLTITASKPARLTLRVRYPAWTKSMSVSVNGQAQRVVPAPGSYIAIEREWKTGDVVSVRLPMALHTEAMPDDPKMIAVMYGPVVLAADLGTAGLDKTRRYGPSEPAMRDVPAIDVPAFVVPDTAPIVSKITKVAGRPLTFQTSGLGQPSDVTLVPFNTIFVPRYNVYWTVYTPTEWKKHNSDLAVLAARRKDIERRSIDTVDVNSDESEKAHEYAGERVQDGEMAGRRWRDTRDGWFSYTLRIDPSRPVTILALYRGSEGTRRAFDVLVDREKIASETLEYHPTEMLDREYRVPERLTTGKTSITVRFQPQANARTGGVFEVRTIQ